ncbi:zinc-binding protein A33-like [Megalops cyprinoides]|uniref:zinc-binding protein A33-like n=1 Tax=Megalops cyprinoides TaxID=118141 RepID=UPI0018655542|nr:zinc-binding protein A33-like [Megalops cyprinoides]
MTKWIQSLSDTIGGVEQEMEAPRVSFLHNYEATMKSTQCTVEDPESLSEGELIDTAKHLGSLKYRVWEKMQGICQYTPVTLDPNTAMPNLLLSEELSRVSLAGENRQLPDNPERFRHHSIVLGSEGFTAGRHTWDIEVGNNTHWVLGVAQGSVRRKEEAAALSSRHGLWAICQINGEYSALASPTTPLSVKWRPRMIRVALDWDKGKVTFSDPIYDEHIHTYRSKFTEKLFPYFLTLCKLHHLQILPQKVSVKVV